MVINQASVDNGQITIKNLFVLSVGESWIRPKDDVGIWNIASLRGAIISMSMTRPTKHFIYL